jgi:hypothetical protein
MYHYNQEPSVPVLQGPNVSHYWRQEFNPMIHPPGTYPMPMVQSPVSEMSQRDSPSRHESMGQGRRMIRRKPVPDRMNSRRSNSNRPASSRSFAKAFSWLSSGIPDPDVPILEEPKPSAQVPKPDRNSYRFTSQFDPRMQSGLTLYDPDLDQLEAQRKWDHSTRSSIHDALNFTWQLPPLLRSMSDGGSNRSVIEVAYDAPPISHRP